jgi:hypothetical protein
MALETTECITINNKGKIYTDCMEFSLLRFFQMMHYEPAEIEQFGSSQYNTKYDTNYNTNYCSNTCLLNFINKYPLIYPKADYYLKAGEGTTQREEWATLVSDKCFLDYYRNDKAELFTSVTNIIKFFNGFNNMNLDIYNQKESLHSIGKFFTTDSKKITLKIKDISMEYYNFRISDIMKFISRPEDKYNLHDPKLYKVAKKTTTIEITINNDKYLWYLIEMYICDSNVYTNNYITGHSVIHIG